MARIRRPDVAPGPLADLLGALRLLYLRAGEPTMRELADRTQLISRDTVHRVLTCAEMPRWRSFEAVVAALGGDVEQFRDLWVSASLTEEGGHSAPHAATPETARSQSGAPAATQSKRPGASQGVMAPSSGNTQGGTRVLVVDDFPLWRRELTTQLKAAGWEVVASVGSAAEAVREAGTKDPHVVVTAMHLPDRSGAQLCRDLRTIGATARVLLFSASGDPGDVRQAVSSGAAGYLLKSSTRDELLDGVRRTAAGESVFSPKLAGAAQVRGAAPSTEQSVSRLTMRETAVLSLITGGVDYREAAQRLGISARTVQNDVHRMQQKLHLGNRLELVRYAVQRGLAVTFPGRRIAGAYIVDSEHR